VVLLAFAGLALVLAISIQDAIQEDNRVTEEVYNYHLFVRLRDPEANVELRVPVPDFLELRNRTSVNETFVNSPFPSRNVTQSIEDSPYGVMFRFLFSESFAVWGRVAVAPGSANETLTFSSQVSNRVWMYLANVSAGNQVSMILYYEVAQIHGSPVPLTCNLMTFVGTGGPRAGPGLIAPSGYLRHMASDENAYTALSSGWGSYRLVDGRFKTCTT
jgi:hypothetical protein